jgi:putative membrane protein
VQTPAALSARRGLGWDIDTGYSSPRGEKNGTQFPLGSFGHTGFTGPSIWIDPHSKTFVIFLSLTSPLHILSDHYLFSAHMLQHVLITLICPPLLIVGTPGWLASKLFQHRWSISVFRRIFHPLGAVVIFNIIFSMWHLPILYNLSVSYHWVHILEHSLFISASIVMWWPICSQVQSIPKLPYPIQMLYLFVMSLAQIIVFGIITFAREPIYQHYIDAPRIWNISPLVDQQLGGIIMKVGSGFLFLFLIIIAFFKWFDEDSNSEETAYNEPDSTEREL